MGGWWEQVGATVREEFSDLPDAAGLTRITIRLLLAAVLGGVLGYERESKGKAAGLRTHMLVALGAALFVLVPQQYGMSNADLSRVVQGLVTGLGFLGAGAIIKGDGDEEIKGVTTAAGLWLTAAIGVAAGMGRDATAVLSTGLALAILAAAPRITRLFDRAPARPSGGAPARPAKGKSR
jgi:putative Mg2+ transporter-C (MgtC) family protein